MKKKYPIIKKCVVCNSDFIVKKPWENRNIACSKVCGDKHAAKTRSGVNHWNFGNPRKIKDEKHPFFGKHHSKDIREKISLRKKGNSPSWNKGRITPKETILKMSLAKKGQRSSPKTEFKKGLTPWNKGKKFPQFSGSNNPSWKGGITPIHNKIRGSVEYKIWERVVRERDKGCCQKCGDDRIKYSVAHHILNFSSHPELRFAIDNGITFCRSCHRLFHKIYTVRNNSRKQLLEFLKN